MLKIILILLFILIYYLAFRRSQFIAYPINNKIYNVLDNETNQERAAQILYEVDNKITQLINYLDNKYKNSNNDKIKYINYRLKATYNSESLTENFPSKKGSNVSYNVNKGKEISLCLRDYNTKNFHDVNNIMFVAIHELAHSCTKSYDHNYEFWNNFKFLLENAIESNLYRNINYKSSPTNYCSMTITYNPIFDKTLKKINE